MVEQRPLLVERDPTVARVAETALRMMAGSVGVGTMRAVQDAVRASPSSYPWQQVCELVVEESVDPSDLVNRGIVAQRDWVQRDGGQRAAGARAGVSPSAPAAAARPKRPASNAFKRFVARAIVRGAFYLVFAIAFAVILVLVEKNWQFSIYEFAARVQDLFRG